MFWSRVLSMLQTIFLSRISCSALDRLLDSTTVRSITLRSITLGSLLLACPLLATAQRHGGGGGSTGGGLSGISRPDGVSEKDSLKDFHDAMAVQATSQQVAAFQGLLKTTEAAQAGLQQFLQALHSENAAPDAAQRDALDRSVENTRTWNKTFQQGFSPEQKSGLKEIAKRLAKTDSDLEQYQKKLDQSLEVKAATPEILAHAESLEKAFSELHNQQLALGREMSIMLASGQDLAFTLPPVRSTVNLGGRTLPVAVSGVLTQIAAQGGQRKFKLELSADLSELQQNIFEILSAQLNTSESCGQRIGIRQAMLTPATPASLLVVRLHFERWICTRSFGQQTSNELAEGDGSVEIKLTAALEPSGTSTPATPAPTPNTFQITAAFSRVNATGMLEEELRSGSLGDELRHQAVQSVLSAARAGSDFKSALPPAVQNSATIQSVRFQDIGVGGLRLVLDGQIEISNEQADQLANQLNQTLSAQAPASR
jgi:hypothetical protein